MRLKKSFCLKRKDVEVNKVRSVDRKRLRYPNGQLPDFNANLTSSIVSTEQFLPTGHTLIHFLIAV